MLPHLPLTPTAWTRTYPSLALESNRWPYLRGEPRRVLSADEAVSPGSTVREGTGDTCLEGFTWRGGRESRSRSPSPGPFSRVAG